MEVENSEQDLNPLFDDFDVNDNVIEEAVDGDVNDNVVEEAVDGDVNDTTTLSEGRDPSLFDANGRLILALHSEPVKEFDVMVRNWRTPKCKAYVVENLYGFMCSMALDNCKKEDKTKYIDLYPKLVTLFDAALESTALDSFFVDNMMYHSALFGTAGTIFLL